MDVRCSRCSTDYEFDDTLISERGTTVKCTNCGYQFKIYPPKSADSAPERWLVRTSVGKELVFTSLRELQRGISEKKVGPNDLLSRGRQPARPLGSIPELEPFFASAVGPSRAFSSPARTLHGVAPPPSGSPRPEKDERPTSRGIGQKGTPKPTPADTNGELPTMKLEPGALSTTLPVSNPVPPSGYSQRTAEPRVLGAVAPTDPAPTPARPPPKPARSDPAPKPSRTDPMGASATPAPDHATPVLDKTVRLPPSAPKSFDTTMPAATDPQVIDTNPPPPGSKSAEAATPPPPPLPPVAAATSTSAPRTAAQGASRKVGALDNTLPVASQPRAARPAPSQPLQQTPPPPHLDA